MLFVYIGCGVVGAILLGVGIPLIIYLVNKNNKAKKSGYVQINTAGGDL